jgi:hypothetical protein
MLAIFSSVHKSIYDVVAQHSLAIQKSPKAHALRFKMNTYSINNARPGSSKSLHFPPQSPSIASKTPGFCSPRVGPLLRAQFNPHATQRLAARAHETSSAKFEIHRDRRSFCANAPKTCEQKWRAVGEAGFADVPQAVDRSSTPPWGPHSYTVVA